MRPEGKFTKELQDSVKYLLGEESFIRKIPDAPRANLKEFCDGCREKIARVIMFTPRRPFDLFAVVNKSAYMIEVKHHGTERAWPIGSVTEKQFEALNAAHKAGAFSFVLLYCSAREVAYWLPSFFLFETLLKGKKSIRLDDLDKYGVPMVKEKRLGIEGTGRGRTVWNVLSVMGNEGALLCKA